jgi:hypothetical protein
MVLLVILVHLVTPGLVLHLVMLVVQVVMVMPA